MTNKNVHADLLSVAKLVSNTAVRAAPTVLLPVLLLGPRRTHVKCVLLIFEAIVIDQLAIEHQRGRDSNRPRFGVCLRILYGHLNDERAEVGPRNPLRDLSSACQRIAVRIEPQIVAE